VDYGKGGGVYSNLFDTHPPFQIDGNFGGTAGIAEMLVQSHAGEINLLPALPSAWPDGTVEGLRVRGGMELFLSWQGGRVTGAFLKATADSSQRVRAPKGQQIAGIRQGASDVPAKVQSDGTVTFEAQTGKTHRDNRRRPAAGALGTGGYAQGPDRRRPEQPCLERDDAGAEEAA
jgi:alpha-L-fucosidase 2